MGTILMDMTDVFGPSVADCKKLVAGYRAADASEQPLSQVFDKAARALMTPLVRWVDEEEKRLQRELTNEEIDCKRKNLAVKHKRAVRHFDEMRPVVAELAEWEELEEERIGRELTDEECDNKRIELMLKYGIRNLE